MPTELRLSSPVTAVPRVGPAKAKYLHKLGIRAAKDFLYLWPRRYDDFSRITKIADLRVGETMTVRGKVKRVEQKWGFRGKQRLLRIFVDIEDDTGVLAVTWFNLRFLPRQLWEGRELFVAGKVEPLSDRELQARLFSERQSGSRADTSKIPHPQPLNGRGKQMLGNTPPHPSPWKGEGGRWKMRSPVLEFVGSAGEGTHTGRITPVYPETYGVTSRFLRYQVKQLLPLLRVVPEWLPQEMRQRNNLIDIQAAIREVHFPTDAEALERAQRRLRFDELFFLQLAAAVRRRQRVQQVAPSVAVDAKRRADFVARLPFVLTDAQATALDEVFHDLAREVPMNRLLQGDVGSGKSVVAQAAADQVLAAGGAVLYLAPTEVLARQQYQSFTEALGGERVALLLGAQRLAEKRAVKQRLADGEACCVVGTHALLQDGITGPAVGLAVVDEQHRFGVAQRKALQEVRQDGLVPHLLSMTATPIPRTLNLTVYGDLDVSVLRELPTGRKPIVTEVAGPSDRERVYEAVRERLRAGQQAYVIAPLVDPTSLRQEAELRGARQSRWDNVKSAKQAFEEMQKIFPEMAVGLLHGRLSSEEKDGTLRSFAAGALQLLVATAVVEVGVNVPNASIMLIEGAERFGLAQLHQFRGRIGRGEHQSYCYLFPSDREMTENTPSSPPPWKGGGTAVGRRLEVLVETTDGFVIAEEDLKLRGPGEMYGVAQSGFGDLQVASLLDYEMIKLTRGEAEQLLEEDPELASYPLLKGKVAQKNSLLHLE